MSDEVFTARIAPGYVNIRSLYLEKDAWATGQLYVGQRATVLINGDEEFSVEGKLNSGGGLSGMAKLYKRLKLKEGDEVKYSIPSKNTLVVQTESVPDVGDAEGDAGYVPVFKRKDLAHLHIEPFRPESLDHWEPETETDVYLAFGVLQQFTDYFYCCGTSKALLQRLGAYEEGVAKPDAILIERASGRYMMAEWKIHSASFASNHHHGDVDVLVCWHDDATKREDLPKYVVHLHAIAKQAATEMFFGSDPG